MNGMVYMLHSFKSTTKIKVQHEPKSTILFPEIDSCKEIHMYNDHSLWLHYPSDMSWNVQTPIYIYTVPWVSEWIVFYELYLVNGNIWEGKESPTHIRESDKNINKNVE